MRTAIYACSTDDYVPKVVTALASFQRFHPHFGYFVFGRGFRPATIELIESFGMTHVPLDLDWAFPADDSSLMGVRECFWITAVPEILHGMGYTHSLSVDGDVLCARELPLDWLPKVEYMAGIQNGHHREYVANVPWVKAAFGISDEELNRIMTNTGAVWWRHEALREIEFFDRCVKTYNRCAGHSALPGDQTLLAIATLIEPPIPIDHLDDTWNFRFHPEFNNRDILVREDPDLKIVHFVGSRPWEPRCEWGNKKGRLRIPWVDRWREFAVGLFGDQRAAEFFGTHATRPVAG